MPEVRNPGAAACCVSGRRRTERFATSMIREAWNSGQPTSRRTVGICDSQPATAEGVRAVLREDTRLEWRWSAFSVEAGRKQQMEDPVEILLIDRALGAVDQ